MKWLTILGLLLFQATAAQNNEKIVGEIFELLFSSYIHPNTIYLQGKIEPPLKIGDSLSLDEYYRQKGPAVPQKVFADWKKNLKSDSLLYWNESKLNQTLYNRGLQRKFKCMTQSEVDSFPEMSTYYRISQVLLDDSERYALLEFAELTKWNIHGQTLIFRKTSEIWNLFAEFGMFLGHAYPDFHQNK